MSTATSKLSIKDASLWSHTNDTTNFKHTVSTTASATVHTVQVLQYKYYSTVLLLELLQPYRVNITKCDLLSFSWFFMLPVLRLRLR